MWSDKKQLIIHSRKISKLYCMLTLVPYSVDMKQHYIALTFFNANINYN